jgi:hypothetical protein
MPEEFEMLPREAAVLCKRVLEVSPVSSCGTNYHSNELRMNVKLGGINTIPDPQSVTVLTDPRNPTIVMGT